MKELTNGVNEEFQNKRIIIVAPSRMGKTAQMIRDLHKEVILCGIEIWGLTDVFKYLSTASLDVTRAFHEFHKIHDNGRLAHNTEMYGQESWRKTHGNYMQGKTGAGRNGMRQLSSKVGRKRK